ncbi:substrate-binding domain-containing protein [Arthrobacter sulfonylureivorans]|uniref:Substrate-binding domain-containing protein n=1 Tax=Arthrobacter sulfonylureivorans TaxID=2486855 RepID=A0ABY3W608_9MICC|nr:substrate-binding domain-containing protein [Arthrobacter sulfonylureivorans]UNK45720.1 substrate-binding domain-containing protein [Arthrobacter sulfonylureivorans]
MKKRTNVGRPALIGTAVVTLAALGLAGCSAAAAPEADSVAQPAASAAAGQCGSVPDLGANDPDGLLKEFSPETAAAYNAYPLPVKKSAWADWKSEKDGGYTAAIVGMPPASAFVNVMLDTVRKELAAADVEIVADLAPDDPTNVPLQLQQFSQAVALKPDVIFFIPLAGEPSVDAVKAAGEAGIPVIAMQSVVDSEYAVSVAGNSVLQAMKAGASTLSAIGGAGNVLRVTGIPGISTELYAEDGFQNVLELCPDVSIAGEVTGFFEATTAQTATLQYLATNPAGVDAVLQSGTMGLGVLNAFEESGLEVPPLADLGATQGFASWAAQNADYPYVGSTTPTVRQSQVSVDIALRILKGEGPKINQFVNDPFIVDRSNLEELVDPAWKTTDSTDLVGDPQTFFPDEVLKEYFNNPSS